MNLRSFFGAMFLYLLLLTTSVSFAKHVAVESISSSFWLAKDRVLDGGVVAASSACDGIMMCGFICQRNKQCKSASFHRKSKTCFLNKENRKAYSQKLKLAPGYDFMEMVSWEM